MLEILIAVGGGASAIIATITCITLICKPFRNKFVNWIRKQSNSDNTSKELADIKQMLQEHIRVDAERQIQMDKLIDQLRESELCSHRTTITDMYYKYMERGEIPVYRREQLVKAYTIYHAMNGNTYIDTIYPELLELPVATK